MEVEIKHVPEGSATETRTIMFDVFVKGVTTPISEAEIILSVSNMASERPRTVTICDTNFENSAIEREDIQLRNKTPKKLQASGFLARVEIPRVGIVRVEKVTLTGSPEYPKIVLSSNMTLRY